MFAIPLNEREVGEEEMEKGRGGKEKRMLMAKERGRGEGAAERSITVARGGERRNPEEAR